MNSYRNFWRRVCVLCHWSQRTAPREVDRISARLYQANTAKLLVAGGTARFCTTRRCTCRTGCGSPAIRSWRKNSIRSIRGSKSTSVSWTSGLAVLQGEKPLQVEGWSPGWIKEPSSKFTPEQPLYFSANLKVSCLEENHCPQGWGFLSLYFLWWNNSISNWALACLYGWVFTFQENGVSVKSANCRFLPITADSRSPTDVWILVLELCFCFCFSVPPVQESCLYYEPHGTDFQYMPCFEDNLINTGKVNCCRDPNTTLPFCCHIKQ